MTGSPIQTGIRLVCRLQTAVLLENQNIADRSKRREQTSQRQFHEGKRKNPHDPKHKQMYFSDDSISYETTASQDERIEQSLQEEKEEEKSRQKLIDRERQQLFDDTLQEKSHEIFHLLGLTFLKFTHTKIKFCFEPSKVVTLVRNNVRFFCSLRYYKKYHYWNVRRDSFPINYKIRIYNIFYRGEFFSVTDNNVADAIIRIYVHLHKWAKDEEEFRQEKFMRYQNGEDVDLDSDDEELFLTEDQRKELNHKREMVLKRMKIPTDNDLLELPPEPPERKKKRVLPISTRKKKQHRISSDLTPSPPKKGRRRIRVTITDSE